MKRVLACCVVCVVLQGAARAQVRDLDLGLSFADGSVRSFYLAISEHYGVPARTVVELQERYRCPVDDLPVVYFLAARSHVAPSAIIGLRARNLTWIDIAYHYHLGLDIFFVPVSADPTGPPYGHAYGYYRKQGPGRASKGYAMTDREVVDLVNLRFMSEYYGVRPETVMTMRGAGRSFVAINDEVSRRTDTARARHQQKENGQRKK
jgi:hypothetical protein